MVPVKHLGYDVKMPICRVLRSVSPRTTWPLASSVRAYGVDTTEPGDGKKTTKTPMKADVVVCGAGLAGLSVAHHLAKKGVRVAVFDKDCVNNAHSASGTCMGLMAAPSFFADRTMHDITTESVKLYEQLAHKYRFMYSKCGRVYMASSDLALWNSRRIFARSHLINQDAELVDDQSDMLARWPMLDVENLQAALFSPDDVVLDTAGLCAALASEIRANGGRIFEKNAVKKVLIGDGNKVFAVATDGGLVETRTFVNAAGIWSSMIKLNTPMAQTRIAMHPCTYTYLMTNALPNSGISDMTPVFVDMDKSTIFRATDYQTIISGFHQNGISALNLPNNLQSDWNMPTGDWDKFYLNLKNAMKRCPSIGQLDAGELICGAEGYTPDMFPVLGEYSDSVRGFYVINGFNGKGLPYAGGMGSLLADWIIEGTPNRDVSKVESTRFLDLHTNPQYLVERVPEVASKTFEIVHHSHQCQTARNLRMSPIYHQLRNKGAVFGEIMGYERPLWFTNDVDPTRNSLLTGQDPLCGKPDWFPYVAREYEACRERVGIIDMTSFAKLEVGGSGVVQLLQKVCSANVDKPVGSTVYTGMQNERGGYVTDCTISRIADDKFFIVAPTVQQLRCANWLRRWIRETGLNVYINDVTSMYTALNIVGPSSRYLMQDVTGQNLTPTEFPAFAYREIDIGMATGIRAISVTHCGELGWVLYIPNEVAQNVYDRIVDAGQEYSALHAGYYTLRHLRIEKFYVYWGQDISSNVTPVECGRTFRVDFGKDFIGRDALFAQTETGVNKRFVQLLIDKHDRERDPWPQGREIIFRDGIPCGWTTSATYGFTLGCQVCIGYIENHEFGVSPVHINSGSYEIDIGNKRFPARVNMHSPSLPMVSSEHPIHYRPTQ
uniref:DAO domain-containing protein n=1 Tax=Panagrellus redivivus TaxID=6233 RepID=A0A7E4ZTD6_PANRE